MPVFINPVLQIVAKLFVFCVVLLLNKFVQIMPILPPQNQMWTFPVFFLL